MTMPCPPVGRTKLSHRIWYFFIWSFVAAHVTCSNSEWGFRDFLWTKGTPKYISRNRAALVNISREQGNKPNFGGSECSMEINIVIPLLILESCCPWTLNSLVLCPALLHVLVITCTVHFTISGTAYLSAYQFLDYPAAPRVSTSLSLLISKPRGTLHFNLGIQNQ